MKKPIHQRIIQTGSWVLLGVVGMGGVFGMINDALTLVSFRLACLITAIILIGYIILRLLFHYRKIRWVDDKGRPLSIVKFSDKLEFGMIGAVMLLFAGPFYHWYQEYLVAKNAPPEEPPAVAFAHTRPDQFNILILPFDLECQTKDGQGDVGKVLQKRLNELDRADSIHINTYYLTDSIDFRNFTHANAVSLMNYHRADLILYGSYSSRQCESGQTDKICFNYQTDYRKWQWAMMRAQTEYKMQDIAGLEDLRRGAGQENIDYVIYKVAAISELRKCNYQRAIDLFKKISQYEDKPDILFQLAHGYFFTHKDNEAARCLQRVLVLNPDDLHAIEHLGNTYLHLGMLDSAQKYLEKVVHKDARFATAMRSLGSVYAAMKDTVKANECYMKVVNNLIVAEPTPRNLTLLGITYYNLRNKNSALNCFERTLLDDPGNYLAQYHAGIIYIQRKDSLKARLAFQQAVRIEPTNEQAWYELGLSYGANRSDSARYCLQKAIAIYPAYFDAWVVLGTSYVVEGKPGQAAGCFEKALTLSPSSSPVLLIAARTYRQLKKFREAIRYLERLLKNDPKDGEAWNEMGVMYAELENYSKALTCYKRSMPLLPENAAIYYNLASASASRGESGNALRYLQHAVSLRPELKKMLPADRAFDSVRKRKEFEAMTQ